MSLEKFGRLQKRYWLLWGTHVLDAVSASSISLSLSVAKKAVTPERFEYMGDEFCGAKYLHKRPFDLS